MCTYIFPGRIACTLIYVFLVRQLSWEQKVVYFTNEGVAHYGPGGPMRARERLMAP